MKDALCVLTLLAVLGFAGTMDHQDAVKAEQVYCKQVADGLPDWKGVGCE